MTNKSQCVTDKQLNRPQQTGDPYVAIVRSSDAAKHQSFDIIRLDPMWRLRRNATQPT